MSPRVMRIVFVTLLVMSSASARAAGPASPTRAAITRALPLLQRSAATFAAQRTCVSCHHNLLAILTLRAAQRHGFNVDAGTLDAVETKTFRQLRGETALDDAVQGLVVSDPTPNESLLLMAAHEAGIAPDFTTAVMARRMARWQHDGHWTTSDFRPPHSSSEFTATATAIRAIRVYMPSERGGERDAAIARAREWLTATRGDSTEDAAFRVLGLVWADAVAADTAPAIRDLQSRQRPDGGWAQLPRPWRQRIAASGVAGRRADSCQFLSRNVSVDAIAVGCGAKPQPPDDVRVRRKPLVFASMTGDTDVVRLLLSRGAQPDSEALSEAVTFDHPDIVKALIDAGADASITESSGINLLHWAAITNRPAVIPILASAGVPVDAIDDAGYTPLMYAATVDVGGTETLQALLAAGASRSVRNARGRTPIQQAQFYRHAATVDALK
jgi:hypothetical protein